MTWRRAAAICLLVFCLSVSAIVHFASLRYPDLAGDELPQPEFSALGSELALVLANKIENPSGPELAPAVLGRLGFLRVFGANGKLLQVANDQLLPSSEGSAIEIRGPPDSFLG